ncbi:hypothetical protein RFI_00149 [Reticulomyxa filosa]|uniref:Hsp70 family protein n=1 Tax=Reticulomyxa filosa TaxID=46433 RepID=X6PGW3_RETFI|nr:hypothetical protein RFI_00149 [Reticulomyxa filosa]|eukprot:ETO36912.1 hypothetical protein RFI_00149 [Reticulomyxa filosa]
MLFDEVIDKIVDHTKQLLQSPELKENRLKYICLVGGFSQSPYLQQRMRDEFRKDYELVIPQRPILSVVRGAAVLDKIASFVIKRKVQKTYGIYCGWPLELAKLHPNITKEYLDANTYVCDIDNQSYVRGCFSVIVNKGDDVSMNEKFTVDLTQNSKKQRQFTTTFFWSDDIDPGIINENNILGKIVVPYPKGFDAINDGIFVNFYFGNTVIRATVSMKGEEYIEKCVPFKYVFNTSTGEREDVVFSEVIDSKFSSLKQMCYFVKPIPIFQLKKDYLVFHSFMIDNET